MKRGRVILAHHRFPARQLNKIASHDGARWVFLAQDYSNLLEWKHRLGRQFVYVDVSIRIKNASERLRSPFLDLIASLGESRHSPAWWSSRVSERNTTVSQLFLYCCYLEIAGSLFEESAEDLLIVSESWELLDCISEEAESRGIETVRVRRRPRFRIGLSNAVRIGLRILRLFWRGATEGLIGFKKIHPKTPCVLIHTYLEEGSLGSDGYLHDRYFPNLSSWLAGQGFSVVTLPVLFNLKSSRLSMWRRLQSSKGIVLNPFGYYRFGDYLFAIKESWKALSLFNQEITLEGMQIGRLCRAEALRTGFGGLEALLYSRLPLRLENSGVPIHTLIAEFENMINEKLLFYGFKRFMPDTYRIGYQHGALFPLLLCGYLTEREARYAPLPDRIVCHSDHFRDILTRDGLPSELVAVGPSLRYLYLFDSLEYPSRQKTRTCDKNVLVALPFQLSEAAELVCKALCAFADTRHIKILFKVHPMGTPTEILRSAGLKELPTHMTFVHDELRDLADRVKVAVSSGSTSIFELLARGIPVVVVGRETALDFNPLAYFPGHDDVITNPVDLQDAVLKILNASAAERTHFTEFGISVIKSCFSPITDSNRNVFLMEPAQTTSPRKDSFAKQHAYS